MKKHAGITLIELMIVIAILAVIAGLAAPSFNQMIRSSRVSTASNELLAAMQLARAEAIKQRRQITVCRRNAAGSACDGDADWSAGWLVQGPTGVIRVWEPPRGGLALAGPAGGVTFNPDGRLDPSIGAGCFDVLIDDTRPRQLDVAVTGRAHIEPDPPCLCADRPCP